MSDDLIKRSDAIEEIYKARTPDVASHQYAELFINAVCRAPSADRPREVIAQVTFDEEKLREIVKEAVERFKEEYEVADSPQGEWIPCSERLPSEDEQDPELGVIVTLGNGYDGLQYDWYHDGHWYDWNGFVVAWMPLPEPWKGESDATKEV